ncbi:unnamed protein product [Cladocopium goreaui]|uniref:Myosin-2 n=1 Tax=Cladocopium goreaui TaxID=2562237 RepID=A0A9P1DVS6_9DINO|nr:unnamed protein product [Cladocopium goreaui]
MPRRAPGSELERWQQQLLCRALPGARRPIVVSPSSAEVVSELTELLSQLRKEPEGPELFRMNDRANELLKLLPLQHSSRLSATREALVLPGRPGYLYFGRCATLPYVAEAARALTIARPVSPKKTAEEKEEEEVTPSDNDENPGDIFLLIAARQSGFRWRRRCRLAAGRLVERRELQRERRKLQEEEVKKQKAEWQERLDVAQKRQKVDPSLLKDETSPADGCPGCPKPQVGELLNVSATLDKDSPEWVDFQRAVRWPLFRWRSGLFNLTYVKSLEAPQTGQTGHFADFGEDFRQSELEFALRWARAGASYASLMHGCWSTG